MPTERRWANYSNRDTKAKCQAVSLTALQIYTNTRIETTEKYRYNNDYQLTIPFKTIGIITTTIYNY